MRIAVKKMGLDKMGSWQDISDFQMRDTAKIASKIGDLPLAYSLPPQQSKYP
jgi:hypothetical protein